ncbi:MAG: NAD(P)-binding domain-containing protein [Planctomycetaceae bacterium]|nr:NAD(P)-binding domain-containing protein [Planctomycetaceae bacterium]
MTTFTRRNDAPPPGSRATARILVADAFEAAGLQSLRDLGCETLHEPELTAADLPARLAALQPEVLVVRETAVTAAAIEACQRLSLIVQAGAGVDEIDLAAASKRGVFVSNCPGRNAHAVAELAWALVLACDRRVPDQVMRMREGKWDRADFMKSAGLHGRTMGIVGLGQVGMEIARRAKTFGMGVVAWSRHLTEEKADAAGVHYCANIVNLAKLADVVCVCVATNEETDGLVGEKFMNALKPGAILVNISSGRVIDESALAAAVKDRGIRAGLDVFAREPEKDHAAFDHPLAKLSGVYGTFHVGANTEQAAHAVASESVRVIREWLDKGTAPNCVNRARQTPATTLLSVRHLNRPGVLAHVFYTLGQAGINVEEMENIIYEGGEAAMARIHLDQAPNDEHLTSIRKNPAVLSAGLFTIVRRA